MNKKIAICLPAKEDGRKQGGILERSAILMVEDLLRKDPDLDFLGNFPFSEISIVNNAFLIDGIDIGKADLFFWHASAITMLRKIDELKALSSVTRVIKSPASLETVQDKFLAHSLLKEGGLPVAEFALIRFDDLESLARLIDDWKEVLVKPRMGSFGNGIIRVSDFATLRDIAGMLKSEHGQEKIFIERFYENDMSQWISTTLISKRAIYGYRKNEDKIADWKVFDISRKGGSAFYVDPSPVRELAERAAEILDSPIVGFDFIKTDEGYKIVDENNCPGFYPEAFKAAGKNVSDLIFNLIKSSL